MPRRRPVIISRAEALELLGPILEDLVAIPREAFNQYNATIRPLLPLNTARGQASDLHELCAQGARERLGGRPNIKLYEEPQSPRFLVNYANQALIQFKKLDADLCPSNSATETAKKFDRQSNIPGLPWALRLTVGLELDAHGTALSSVYLVCTVGMKNKAWYHDLITGEGADSLEFPGIWQADDDADEQDLGETGSDSI